MKTQAAAILLVVTSLLFGVPQTYSQSEPEQKVWKLERSYWQDVQENNLPVYLNLWSQDFLGWPSVSDAPVGKEHITDWITSQTAKGLTFKTLGFTPGEMKITGDIAVVYYRVSYKWQDKGGNGESRALRITHTWRKEGNDWRIIGGMSMLDPTAPK